MIKSEGMDIDGPEAGPSKLPTSKVFLPSSSIPLAPSKWMPTKYLDPPEPPVQTRAEEQEAKLASQGADQQNSRHPYGFAPQDAGRGGMELKRARLRPRRTVDYYGGLARWKIMRSTRTSPNDVYFLRPNPNFIVELLPPSAYANNSSTSFCTRYAHTSTNKIRGPVNCVRWTPEGRRVLTGSASGEFTLWNGLTFNFETILQAHNTSVRAFTWSKSGNWLISAEHSGVVKYFQINMNNLQEFPAHSDVIRDIDFSPNDSRFVTCSDDHLIKIWNFEEMREEKVLKDHGFDVKCCKWHPTKGLIVSGGKDSHVKFWDPRTNRLLHTFQEHKYTVQAAEWNPNGHLVATASRDSTVKIFDIRIMKEMTTLKGHKKEVCSLAWHPIHHDVITSGGSDGSILFWTVPDSAPKDALEYAHEQNVWSLAYHPLGHLLVSASNDHTTRFWSRSRPGGKIVNDRFHIGRERAKEMGNKEEEEEQEDFSMPGLNTYAQQQPPSSSFSSGGRNFNPQNAEPAFPSSEAAYGGGEGMIPGFGRATHEQDFGGLGGSNFGGPGGGRMESFDAGGWDRKGALPSQEEQWRGGGSEVKMRKWGRSDDNRDRDRDGLRERPWGGGGGAPGPGLGVERDEYGRERRDDSDGMGYGGGGGFRGGGGGGGRGRRRGGRYRD